MKIFLLLAFLALTIWILIRLCLLKRPSKLILVVYGVLLLVQAINQTGFCWAKMKYFSDAEIISLYGHLLSPDGAVLRSQNTSMPRPLTSKCCELNRFQSVGEIWLANNLHQTFVGSIFGRAIGTCFVELAAIETYPGFSTPRPGTRLYVDPCEGRTEWLSGG